MGEEYSSRGNRPADFLDPTENCCPPARFRKNHYPCILEGHLTTNPILSALHFQGPESNIYVHFHWVDKQLTRSSFSKVKSPINHVINLEVRKYYKSLISTEVIIFVTYHWKGLCHSKRELKLVIWINISIFILL